MFFKFSGVPHFPFALMLGNVGRVRMMLVGYYACYGLFSDRGKTRMRIASHTEEGDLFAFSARRATRSEPKAV